MGTCLMGSRSNPLATPTEQLYRAYLVKLRRAYLVKATNQLRTLHLSCITSLAEDPLGPWHKLSTTAILHKSHHHGRNQEEDAEPQGGDRRFVCNHPAVRGRHQGEQQACRSGRLRYSRLWRESAQLGD